MRMQFFIAENSSSQQKHRTMQFTRPVLTNTLVERPLLWAKLERGLDGLLTLVVAPGGYGKTTTVSSWLSYRQVPPGQDRLVAWYRIDRLDDRLHRFGEQLVQAVCSVAAGACDQCSQQLQGRLGVTAEQLAEQFVRDLAALPRRLLLILDDYHVVTDPSIHAFVETVLRYAVPSLSLLLLSRYHPPFSVARLRSQRQLVELRLSDLQLTQAETAELLSKGLPVPLPPQLVERLHGVLEGWGAGLQLLTLSLHSERDVEKFLARTDRRSHSFISDYFMDEVLAGQPAQVYAFLLRTSLLPALLPGLCSAVWDLTENAGALRSAELLEHVVRHNLFVIPSNEYPGHYRYHELFQEMLKERLQRTLTSQNIDDLHVRVGRWYAEAGDVEHAIQSYLAGHAELAAAELVEEQISLLQAASLWQQLEHYLDQLPARLVQQNLALLLARGWLYQTRWQFRLLKTTAARVATLLANSSGLLTAERRAQVQAELDLLILFPIVSEVSSPATLQRLHQILAILPARPFLLGCTYQLLARHYQRQGHPQLALQILQDAEQPLAALPFFYTLSLVHARCSVLLYEGRFVEVHQVAANYLKLAEHAQIPTFVSAAHFVAASACYHLADQDEEMIRHCYAVLETPSVSYLSNLLLTISLLLDVLGEHGRYTEGWEVIERFRKLAIQLGSPEILAYADMYEVQLLLLTGKVEQVRDWLQTFVPDRSSTHYMLSGLIWVNGMLHLGDAESLQRCQAGLEAMLERCRASHGQVWVVELTGLQMQLCLATGDRVGALRSLEEVLSQGYLAGQRRALMQPDPAIDSLLLQLQRGSAVQPLAEEVYSRRQQRQQVTPVEEHAAGRADRGRQKQGVRPMVLLSAREREVLCLLANDLSLREVARQLQLSLHTVDNHTRKIYKKLGVDSRLEAILRAQALGLLAPK